MKKSQLIPRPDLIAWSSPAYRRWIRDTKSCLTCGSSLLNEKEAFETHHHRHWRRNDAMYIALCLACHNQLHASESRFMANHRLTKDGMDQACVDQLAEYVESLNIDPRWIMLDALRRSIDGTE